MLHHFFWFGSYSEQNTLCLCVYVYGMFLMLFISSDSPLVDPQALFDSIETLLLCVVCLVNNGKYLEFVSFDRVQQTPKAFMYLIMESRTSLSCIIKERERKSKRGRITSYDAIWTFLHKCVVCIGTGKRTVNWIDVKGNGKQPRIYGWYVRLCAQIHILNVAVKTARRIFPHLWYFVHSLPKWM